MRITEGHLGSCLLQGVYIAFEIDPRKGQFVCVWGGEGNRLYYCQKPNQESDDDLV